MEENKNTEKVISINEDYRVRVADQYNWILEKKCIIDKKGSPNNGKEAWYITSYYGNIGQLIKGVSDRMIRDIVGDITTVAEVYDNIVKFADNAFAQWKDIKAMKLINKY